MTHINDSAASLVGQVIGYVRVSAADQNPERQHQEIAPFKPSRIFEDRASGKDVHRPQLAAAQAYLREGDTLIVLSMDRLARNLDDLRKLVREFNAKKITVRFIKEGLSFTGDDSPMATLLLSVMGAFAEFERSLIRERQKEGIAIAKTKGVYKGRVPALTPEKTIELLARDKANGGKGRAALAREFHISRETLYRYL